MRGRPEIRLTKKEEKIIRKDDIVLFYTGFEKAYGTRYYYTNHPVVSPSVAKHLIEKRIKMMGLDAPSPDTYPFAVHQLLFNAGIFIIENICNLARITGESNVELMAFPLNIRSDSSPARVVAKIK